MAGKGFRIPGLSFSWKRAVGISTAKARLSRTIGIPLTRAGRQRKIGKLMGCCIGLGFILAGTGLIASTLAYLIARVMV